METTQTQVLTVRVEPERYEQISRMAEEEKRPLSMMSRILLDEALDARKKKTTRKQ